MLATGVITSNIQSVQAKTEVKQQSESELKHYYNKPFFERKNVTGYKYLKMVKIIWKSQQIISIIKYRY